MGVDARLFVKTKNPEINKETVHDLAYDLAEAFGPENFFINRTGEYKHHCLELIDTYEQDGPDIEPEEGEKFIEVHLWTRYYGEGYERGDLPLIISIADWLERRITECKVYYGGDSSGICAEEFNAECRKEFFDYFASVGHKPYRGGPEDYLGRGIGRYCDFCEKNMVRYGFGGSGENEYAAFNCLGCSFKESTRDGGKTWKVVEKDDF